MKIVFVTAGIFLCGALLTLSACEQRVPSAPAIADHQNIAATAVQRFVPLPGDTNAPLLYMIPKPFFALDTKTGQLCRTWNFGAPEPNSNSTQKILAELPTCQQLFREK